MALEKLLTNLRLIRHGASLALTRPSSPRTVADVIEAQAAARPSHPFVLHEGGRVTYGEYNANANRVAHWGLSRGIGRGDVVALLMQNRPTFLEVWAGLAKIGATTALINTNLTHRGLAHAIETSTARIAIVGSECLENWETLGADARDVEVLVSQPEEDEATVLPAGAVSLEESLDGRITANPDRACRASSVAGDDLFYIYTSGTTGLPKAARFSHLKFAMTGLAARAVGLSRNDVMYCALPLYHSAGGGMAVSAVLSAGATLALRRKFSTREFWPDVHRYGATCFQYIGEFCRYLLNSEPASTDRGHKIRFAIGNGLRPDIWEEFQGRFAIPRLLEFYGATEGNIATMNYDGKVGSVGKLLPKLIVDARLIRYDVERDEHVRDDRGFAIECGPDEPGELIGKVEGDTRGRFEGYTSREATEKKLLRDLFERGDAWFRTGDLLKRDADGYLYFVDRIGDTFRWKGENVSTQDVSEAISVFPGVEMANVYGVEVSGQDGRAGMVALVLERPESFEPAALFAHIDDALPSYAAPVFVRIQREFEITGTFKLRKIDLQKEGFDPSAMGDPVYVRDAAEKTYAPLTPELFARIESGEARV